MQRQSKTCSFFLNCRRLEKGHVIKSMCQARVFIPENLEGEKKKRKEKQKRLCMHTSVIKMYELIIVDIKYRRK